MMYPQMGLGRVPMQPLGQMPTGQPQMGQPQQGLQLHPAILAALQQMQGLGGYGMQQRPMGLGMGIQPLSPASAYSLR